MARLSRYFTPPISSAQRQLFLEMTLLAHLPIQFKEMKEKQELYTQESMDGILRSKSPSGYRDSNRTECEVRIQLKDWGTALKGGSLSTQGCFFEVAPYPFNLLFLSRTSVPNGAKPLVELYPYDFAGQIQVFSNVVKRLEAEMEESELCFFWVKRNEGRLPLLFHFVRRRLIRVGSLPELTEIGLAFDEGKMRAEEMRQFFGTQVSLFSVDLSDTYLKNPSLPDLINCWERALSEPKMKLRASLPSASLVDSSYPDLQL